MTDLAGKKVADNSNDCLKLEKYSSWIKYEPKKVTKMGRQWHQTLFR